MAVNFEDALRNVAFVIERTMAFVSHAVLFGLPVILLLVIRPAFAPLAETWTAGRQRLAARLEGLVRAAMMASAVATVVALLLQAVLIASLLETPLGGSSFESVFSTSFGQWHLFRLPLLAGLYVLLMGQVSRWALEPGALRAAWWSGWLLLAGLLMVTSSFTGHAAVSEPRALGLGADMLHLAAGSVWFTGIVMLAVFLPDAWREQDETARLALLAPTVVRFSLVALIAIALVAITGSISSFLNIAAWDDLIDSGYGVSLVVKLFFFIGVLAMGGVNHFFLRDRMHEPSSRAEAIGAERLFRKTVAIELVIGLSIMAATGILTGGSKTRQATQPPPGLVSSGSTP